MNNLTEETLTILLALHGNKRLDDALEKEIFDNYNLIEIYVRHLYVHSNAFVDGNDNLGWNIIYLAKYVIRSRWYPAETFIIKYYALYYTSYKEYFDIETKN